MKKTKNKLIRPIHLQTLLIIIIYLLISKVVFVKFVVGPNLPLSFLGPFVYGSISSIIFLYLFSHEDFFHFIREVEKSEKKKENKYLKKYKHYGKIAVVIIIGVIGGTIFAALTTRLLLMNYRYKYLILLISMFLSTILSVGIVKGVISLI